ncbi:putative HNHc nuclease, partial [Stenotrophomonas maltophilia group sp. RNC7]|uniref:putative HNHc nuclease n=1 Tax=Stenotrophomonas maltophilia group sp. RNC7 TaxID=3071467 RepID=UPI0027E10F35
MHEYAEIKAYKHTEKGTELRIIIPKKELGDYLKRFSKGGIVQAELRLDDGRTISADQRKKIYATIKDISLHTGHMPEEL